MAGVFDIEISEHDKKLEGGLSDMDEDEEYVNVRDVSFL